MTDDADSEPGTALDVRAITPAEESPRDELGRLRKGHSGNPSGRPKLVQDFQRFLSAEAWPEAKKALLECLKSGDGKVRMMAVKEVHDRLFGRAPMTFTDEDGNELKGRVMGIIVLPTERSDDDGE